MKKITDISQIATCIDTYNLQSFLVHDLLSISELYTFEKEEHLIQSQTPSDYLYFLIKGTVRVYTYSSETQNIVINRSQPITLLGEASSLWDRSEERRVGKECRSR